MEVMLFTNALQLALYVAAPVLIGIILAGVFAGVLQTVTQVSDESISFGFRIAAAAVAFLLFSQFIFAELQGFANFSWNTQQSSQ